MEHLARFFSGENINTLLNSLVLLGVSCISWWVRSIRGELRKINGRVIALEVASADQKRVCTERLQHCEEVRNVIRDRISAIQGQVDRHP